MLLCFRGRKGCAGGPTRLRGSRLGAHFLRPIFCILSHMMSWTLILPLGYFQIWYQKLAWCVLGVCKCSVSSWGPICGRCYRLRRLLDASPSARTPKIWAGCLDGPASLECFSQFAGPRASRSHAGRRLLTGSRLGETKAGRPDPSGLLEPAAASESQCPRAARYGRASLMQCAFP